MHENVSFVVEHVVVQRTQGLLWGTLNVNENYNLLFS